MVQQEANSDRYNSAEVTMSNIDSIFSSSIKIEVQNPLASQTNWPMGVDLCITRFPIRKKDGYDNKGLKLFASRLKNSLRSGGIAFIICYAPSECKWRPFEIAKELSDTGLTHIDNIVIEKSWMPGKRSEHTLVNTHEYVFFFCNGNTWSIDRTPVRRYLMLDNDLPCIGNTWLVETGSLDESYSEDLAELLVRMVDLLPGSLVFDPFMGGSSIIKTCMKLGHSLFGFESDPRKIKQYEKILTP